MPHINYARGETRTFVIRREPRQDSWLRRKRSKSSSKGLRKRYDIFIKTGPGGFGCPCCAPKRGDPEVSRVARTREKRAWRKELYAG